MNCLLLGDSIALGLAAALKAGGIACAVAARVGAHSADVAQQIAATGSRPVVILSTGTNDPPRLDIAPRLMATRGGLGPARVIWILPYRRNAAYAVTRIAFRFGDGVIGSAIVSAIDGGYRSLLDPSRHPQSD
jgi:hypothetical protein